MNRQQYKFEKGFNVKTFVIVLSAVLLVSYGLFNARNIILGPMVEIWSPTRDMETSENILVVRGMAKNITSLSLNEKPIFVDTDGEFEERMLLSPGANLIEIKARDRFKNEVVKTVSTYYKQNATSTSNL